VADGKDPAGDRSASRTVSTVEDLSERFLTEHAEAKRKRRTAKEYRRLLENVVLPTLGKKRVTEVTRQDVAKLHHARRDTPTEANRALAVLSTMFNFAERRGERACRACDRSDFGKFDQRVDILEHDSHSVFANGTGKNLPETQSRRFRFPPNNHGHPVRIVTSLPGSSGFAVEIVQDRHVGEASALGKAVHVHNSAR
jgi:Phage integrase, N-terminal SAM-like domain